MPRARRPDRPGPGSWDTLHTRRRCYFAGNPYGFPRLLAQSVRPGPDRALLAYTVRDDASAALPDAIGHFFLDDHRFESLWTHPDRALPKLRRFWAVLTPDFSMYPDWPAASAIWNHYRQQWLGRYWQSHGLRVIPTVNWAGPDTWPWCFDGIPAGQTVALGVPDLREPVTQRLFVGGFNAMVEHLRPALLLVYGRLPFAAPPGMPVIHYDPDWNQIKPRIARQRSNRLQLPPERQPIPWLLPSTPD